MKRILASLIVLFALFTTSCAQNPKEEKKETASVIQMDKQMFLDKVFDYTTGATEWKFQGDKPAVIDFYATWCGPCRMVAPILKDLAKEYGDSIVIYKVDTDKEKELSMAMGIQSLPTIVFIPKTGQPQIIVGAADKATFRRAIDEVLLNKK
ncbi:MAG: thioredoxin [Bacteroidaceae bacterium]|nr:thioredoxin [Bacteroidaceae bacterium]